MALVPSVTRALAERHEALYPRVSALLRLIEAGAARRPDAAVPEAVRIIAEGLLFDVRPFAGPSGRRGLPAAPPDYAGLAATLGQALAALDAYEAANTRWAGEQWGFVWCVPGREPPPVGRLRQKTQTPAPRGTTDIKALRAALSRMIALRREAVQEAGSAGADPEPPRP